MTDEERRMFALSQAVAWAQGMQNSTFIVGAAAKFEKYIKDGQ